MSECNHDCGSCGVKDCGSRIEKFKANSASHIKKVIGVVSGKGGVGKSLVTELLAVLALREGKKAAILDADITGPSIPKAFGVSGEVVGNETGFYPLSSEGGVSVMSINLLTGDETAPVVWRGPVLAGVVKQFWEEVIWGDVDYMFVDMPPGTGDVPLTVFQSVPLDGIVVVSSPQELVGMIVEKAVRMAEMMSVPVLALVENMSYLTCPDCGKKINVFGESKVRDIAAKYNIPITHTIPIDPQLAAAVDAGKIEEYHSDWLNELKGGIIS